MNARCVLLAIVWAALGGGVRGVDMTENWDSYATGVADPVYNERWATIPGAARYQVEAAAGGEVPGPHSAPNVLKIQKLVTYGITRDLAPEIQAWLPEGIAVIGTDIGVLRVTFIVDFNSQNRAEEDVFVELSLGDTHVDETGGTRKPVVAFGMTYGWFGSRTSPRIFDGAEWVDAAGVTTDARFNRFTLEITSEELTLIGEQRAGGSHTVPRRYLGAFDRVSIRTIRQDDQLHYLDDVRVWGGEVVEELPPVGPFVSAVTPASGPASGGTAVTIEGEGFEDGAEVTFGDELAAEITFVSAAEITCVTPPHDPGPVAVIVQNPDGLSASLAGGFTYAEGGGPLFIRGDVNEDGRVDIADPIALLGHLFASQPAPNCADAADGNDDGALDIADAIAMLAHLFGGVPALPAPFPGCGADPDGSGPGCAATQPACAR